MKRIEDIKEFKDIDTYYEISKIVDEVFQDRVEAHKHLVTANKEIERLNNIIKKLEEFKEEHKIMKQILIENNLWETLLNDDRFLEHLRGSDK